MVNMNSMTAGKSKTTTEILILLVAILLFSCSAKKQVSNEMSKETKVAITSLMIDAKRAEFRNDLPEAKKLLEKILVTDPTNHAAYHELSRIYQYSNPGLALELSKKACELDNTNKWYKLQLANLYKSSSQFDKSADIMSQIIDLEPNNIQNYYNLANLYIDAEKWSDAIKTYNIIEDKFGFDRNISLQRKQIYLKKGDFSSALKELNSLSAREPSNKELHGMIAEIYHSRGNDDAALEHFQAILEIDPDDGKVHLSLADFYRHKGNKDQEYNELILAMKSRSLDVDSKIAALLKVYDKSNADTTLLVTARAMLKAINSTMVNDPKIYAINADFLTREGKSSEALEFYLKAIELDSARFLIWEQIAFIEIGLNKYVEAAAHSRRALSMFAQNPNLYYANGLANYKLGNFVDAKTSLMLGQNFIYSKERKVDFLKLIAVVNDSLGDKESAQLYFDKALTIAPLNVELIESYSWFLFGKGQLTDAESFAVSLIGLEPRNDNFMYLLAKILFSEGKTKESSLWIESGLAINANNKLLLKLYSDYFKAIGDESKYQYYLQKSVE